MKPVSTLLSGLPRGTPAIAYRLRLLACIALLLCVSLPGAVGAPRSVLDSGPEQDRGIPFLYPNVFPYVRAVYESDAGSVEVYYTEAPVSVEEDWTTFQCSGRTLNEFVYDGRPVSYFRAPEGYGLFLIPWRDDGGDVEQSLDLCGFLEDFLDRFSYFRSAVGRRDRVPFPAVLGEAEG